MSRQYPVIVTFLIAVIWLKQLKEERFTLDPNVRKDTVHHYGKDDSRITKQLVTLHPLSGSRKRWYGAQFISPSDSDRDIRPLNSDAHIYGLSILVNLSANSLIKTPRSEPPRWFKILSVSQGRLTITYPISKIKTD